MKQTVHEHMQKVNLARQQFYRKVHTKSGGWFRRKEQTLALIENKNKVQHQKTRLAEAIQKTLDLRKRVLDTAPYEALYYKIIAESTPATKGVVLAY